MVHGSPWNHKQVLNLDDLLAVLVLRPARGLPHVHPRLHPVRGDDVKRFRRRPVVNVAGVRHGRILQRGKTGAQERERLAREVGHKPGRAQDLPERVAPGRGHGQDLRRKVGRAVMRRPLGRLLDYLENIEAQLGTNGKSAVYVSSQPATSKAQFNKVMSGCDAKEIRKGFEALRKRIDKHFGDVDKEEGIGGGGSGGGGSSGSGAAAPGRLERALLSRCSVRRKDFTVRWNRRLAGSLGRCMTATSCSSGRGPRLGGRSRPWGGRKYFMVGILTVEGGGETGAGVLVVMDLA